MLDKSFKEICDGIKKDVKDTQLEIMVNANTNLVNLYYRIGKTLEENSKWGNKFIDTVAFELKNTFPTLKGFSIRNLKYMKTFYNEYKDGSEFVQLVAQLPWKHNITLFQKPYDKYFTVSVALCIMIGLSSFTKMHSLSNMLIIINFYCVNGMKITVSL